MWMDRSSSHGDLYKDLPTPLLIDLMMCAICRILQQREDNGRGQPPQERPGSSNTSPARSMSSWSLITGGPPCSSAQRPPGSAVQAGFCRRSAASSWHNEGGGADTQGRHAGPKAPYVRGYSFRFCPRECSRNKARYMHHRCRAHRNWLLKTSCPSICRLYFGLSHTADTLVDCWKLRYSTCRVKELALTDSHFAEGFNVFWISQRRSSRSLVTF